MVVAVVVVVVAVVALVVLVAVVAAVDSSPCTPDHPATRSPDYRRVFCAHQIVRSSSPNTLWCLFGAMVRVFCFFLLLLLAGVLLITNEDRIDSELQTSDTVRHQALQPSPTAAGADVGC